MSCSTPKSKIYENIIKIQGRNGRKVNILRDGNTTFSTVPEIANQPARTFSNVSIPDNYHHNFLTMKNAIETVPLNFISNNIENYKIFTINELDTALNRTRNTCPGPDGVSYQMLKRLPKEIKKYFLKVMSKYWIDSYFPNKWREAVVIAFPKPGKDYRNTENYRPIALISCICKVMERMINNRLCDYLDMHGMMASVQCGCRRKRSTIDHLVRLETMHGAPSICTW